MRAAARKIELGAQRHTLSTQLGGHLSPYRGRGLEFDEVRPYQEGDDIRSIDWRVTARRGRPHTKLFREERERPILLWIDLHPGMYFGSTTQFKSVLAGRLAALIGWAAVHSGERVGGIVSSNSGEQIIPPTTREKALLQLFATMVRLQPEACGVPEPGRSDSSLNRLAQLAHPGSLILLISDFQQFDSASEPPLQRLSQHNDLICGFLYDPLEKSPPTAGRYPVGDRQRMWALNTASPKVTQRWQATFHNHRDTLRQLCRRNNIHWMEIATNDPLPHTLQLGLQRHIKGRI